MAKDIKLTKLSIFNPKIGFFMFNEGKIPGNAGGIAARIGVPGMKSGRSVSRSVSFTG
ncbi:hypothetical protein [Methanosarcina mazei]|nr:hypothetical protein [Methanosarcina mazei]MDO5840690.1 hypothetical protein [Methanosarcina mazei]MDY0247475.1 hypothetical protein [Methanosarcina mazei]WIM43658.1 hypothetical protein PSF70_02145 [Methanosarcina mazei]WIM47113.1 hypothetical protein PQQ20_02135 [Methanosarcina mazei]